MFLLTRFLSSATIRFMDEGSTTKLIEAMKEVFPTAEMIKRSFDQVDKHFEQIDQRFDKIDQRFDRIENLILADHKRRIDQLENEVKGLKNALAM